MKITVQVTLKTCNSRVFQTLTHSPSSTQKVTVFDLCLFGVKYVAFCQPFRAIRVGSVKMIAWRSGEGVGVVLIGKRGK